MNICVDVGNTTLIVGIYKEDTLVYKLSFITDVNKTSDEYLASIKLQMSARRIELDEDIHLIYSSVVPEINVALKIALEEAFGVKPLCLGPGVKTGINLMVDNPNEVGSDLIADLAGAKARYGYPTIITDLGTASKVLVIDKNGNFVSALIMPGLSISTSNLSNKAALLPSFSLEKPKSVIAKNTIDAMNSGAAFGHADMIVGLANRIEKELGYKCKRILTGGAALILTDIVKDDYCYDSDLVLYGLNVILNKNKRK